MLFRSQQYRNPGQLANGGVLVVGASSSGTQIANEIHHSGRPVTLSVGEHIRAPRVYRGKDLKWWMDAARVLDERYDEVDDIARARRVPSLQLAGSPDRSTLDLNALVLRVHERVLLVRRGIERNRQREHRITTANPERNRASGGFRLHARNELRRGTNRKIGRAHV